MTDFRDDTIASEKWSFDANIGNKTADKGKVTYLVSKRIFDLVVSLAAMPVFVVLCAVIYVLNFFWNPGPLFFCKSGWERTGASS